MYELKKNGKVLTSKFVRTGPSSYEKINLPGRGLTKVEKHWSRPDGYEDPTGQVRKDHLCNRILRPNIFVQIVSLLSANLELLSSYFDTQNGYSEVRRSVSSDSSR